MNFFIKRKEAVKAVKKEADVVTNEQLYSLILSYQEDLNDIKNTLKKINKKLSMIEVSE